MKKILALVLALALMVPALALADDMPVVKIGVYEPASGDSGAGGKQETLGVQYANDETPTVKIGDTEYKVELVTVDNGSSTDKAPSAAQQLVSEGVSVVLGSYGSGVSIAGSQYFADANIPAIGVTCTNRRSPRATATTSACASWIPSRAPFWPTTPPRSWAPPSPTRWASWATTMTRACAPTSARRSRRWAAR